MSDKRQPPRRSPPHVASAHPKRPYKALRMRAQSHDGASGSRALEETKPRKNSAARKAPYKALLIRARSPKPDEEDSTGSDEEATGSQQELESEPRKNDDDASKEPSKKRSRRSRKNSAPKRFVSQEEPEVMQTIANPEAISEGSTKKSSQEPEAETSTEEP